MTLELCEAGVLYFRLTSSHKSEHGPQSLMETLRRRKRFTEPEARVFMIQVVGACNWMHSHQIIHRDLKLGNLFLDSNMNVKVGDFGLAALIENPGERKKYGASISHKRCLTSIQNNLWHSQLHCSRNSIRYSERS